MLLRTARYDYTLRSRGDSALNCDLCVQTSLLLPTEKASSSLIVTPEFVREHVAFSVGPIKEPSSLVTLGGLRGTIDE